jgi:hypothetical protein
MFTESVGVQQKKMENFYLTIARMRTGVSAAFLSFVGATFAGATMISDPVSGRAVKRADFSTT